MHVPLGTFTVTPAIRAAVNTVLDSGRLSYGPVSRQYEQKFAAMHHCRYGVASNSGTSSLVVALQTLKELHGWQDGDEVIVPALTFVATVNAVLHNRLTPVLVDVRPDTYLIDASQIEDAITDRTRCIIPVHLFGQPADVRAVAIRHDLQIIEDSCEAMLATCHGVPVGGLGDIACFSTYAAHLLVTGVGGMAITNNGHIAAKMRSLVNHGINLDELPTGEEYDPTFLARKFRFASIGHSFRMTEIEAAIGLAQLDTLPAGIDQRRQNAEYLTKRLASLENAGYLRLPVTAERYTHSWMVYPIVLSVLSKWPVMQCLQEHDIECREMMPLTCQPCYNYDEDDYPVAKHINQHGFYIGVHQELTAEQLDYMADVLTGYFDGIHE